VVVLPAIPQASALAAQFGAMRDSAPPSTLEALARAGLSYGDAASRVVDLTGLRELGRIHVAALGIRDAPPWLVELLATYAAYMFLAERDPISITAWNVVSRAVMRGTVPITRRLEDFDVQLAPETYLWFQSQFCLQAAAVLEQMRGRDLFDELRHAKLISGTASLPTTELIDRLDKIAPVFRAWLDENFHGV
jgi:hypothetical protein